MTISSLSGLPYASLLASQSGSGNTTSATTTDSGSIGNQLLAALAQSQASSSSPSDPLLQEMVSLSPVALGQASTAPQTYNAQGLLQQIQSSMLLNDPLLQTDATDSGGTSTNSLLQSLISSHQTSSSSTNAVGTANASASLNGGSTSANSQSQVPANTAGSTDPNANWAKLLKQNPSLASVLVQSQTEQGLIAMLGQ